MSHLTHLPPMKQVGRHFVHEACERSETELDALLAEQTHESGSDHAIVVRAAAPPVPGLGFPRSLMQPRETWMGGVCVRHLGLAFMWVGGQLPDDSDLLGLVPTRVEHAPAPTVIGSYPTRRVLAGREACLRARRLVAGLSHTTRPMDIERGRYVGAMAWLGMACVFTRRELDHLLSGGDVVINGLPWPHRHSRDARCRIQGDHLVAVDDGEVLQ